MAAAQFGVEALQGADFDLLLHDSEPSTGRMWFST
jgi:hypothetical protein